MRFRSQKVGKNGWAEQALTMTTLEQFKQVRTSVAPEMQSELFQLMSKDPDASISRMVEIAGENGLKVSNEEVRSFLRQMDDDEEWMTLNWMPLPSPLLLVDVMVEKDWAVDPLSAL